MRYRVRVTRATSFDVEVDGKGLFAASAAAEAEVKAGTRTCSLESFNTHGWTQLGEPWVYGCGWESGDISHDEANEAVRQRPDRYLESPDLLVFRRGIGNTFTKEDVDLLRERAERVVGVRVASVWNGDGCSSLSIRMSESFSLLSREQIDALLAPR